MKKFLLFVFLVIFLNSCTFQHRPDHFSVAPLKKSNHSKLLTNKNANNQDFFSNK